MEKITIKNRKNQNIVVLLEKQENQKGLAFVMHGLSGRKEELHIATFAKAFHDNGYTVVRFDTTNTFGESDGSYADATITNYFEDLEDVIDWSNKNSWYEEPFCLAGHSLGGISTAYFAEKYPEKVRALAPISTVISGKLSITNPKYKDIEEMKKRGWIQEKNGVKLKYQHLEDRFNYDLIKDADKLTMPVLLITGELDYGTPPEHQKMLFDVIPGEKEIHTIKGAPHTFKNGEHLREIGSIFNNWIKNKVL
jgi:pimeloyl-ACP methyl ester carboxylesterase